MKNESDMSKSSESKIWIFFLFIGLGVLGVAIIPTVVDEYDNYKYQEEIERREKKHVTSVTYDNGLKCKITTNAYESIVECNNGQRVVTKIEKE